MPELKRCPFCGGKAEIQEIELGSDCNRTTIVCRGCGVTLEWVQEFYIHDVKDPISGELLNTIRSAHNMSATDAWNRRVGDDCMIAQYVEDCEDCGFCGKENEC